MNNIVKEDKILNCRKCKYFNENKINKDSTIYYCKLNKKYFLLDENQLSTNLKCYKEK